MKNWNMPELVELDLSKTAHKWTGIYRDGGYIGDGEISGHLSWNSGDAQNPCKPTPTPTVKPTCNPTKPLS